MKIRLKIMYDGTRFCGWQVQPKGRSIQGELEDAVFKLTGEKVSITGSGRTDAGVHALGQVASFEIARYFDINKIPPGLNFYLPEQIRVIEAEVTDSDFNARFSAKRKTYVYQMYMAKVDNPLLSGRALRIGSADIPIMKKAAGLFKGKHDFKCFMSSGSNIKTTVRVVYKSVLTAKRDSITFEIQSSGFLYNMVRKIVGVILAAGQGKRDLDSIVKCLNEPFDEVKEISPACGLYLKEVKY